MKLVVIIIALLRDPVNIDSCSDSSVEYKMFQIMCVNSVFDLCEKPSDQMQESVNRVDFVGRVIELSSNDIRQTIC